MDNGVIISLILGGASIISSISFGLVPTIRKNKLDKLVEKQQKLFYEIEDELLNKLEEHGLNKNSTKVQVRKIVSDKNGGKKLSDNSKPSVFNK